jgi:hypothetical protein
LSLRAQALPRFLSLLTRRWLQNPVFLRRLPRPLRLLPQSPA